MVIRELEEKDIEQILDIEAEAFSTPWSRQSLLTELINPKSHFKVILNEDEIIGYAGLWQIFDEGHINNIAVKHTYRNQGIGKMIMTSLLKGCNELGMDRFTLEVRVSNVNAVKLYESLGFESAGIRKGYYDKPKEDAVVMWKEQNLS